MKLIENQVAIVTGGSRGIGEAIAVKFAENGAHVAFTYVSSDEKAMLEKLSNSQNFKPQPDKNEKGFFEKIKEMFS